MLTCGLVLPAAATHLLGGEARYRYLGATGTTPGRPFQYELTFSIYYNCEVNSGPTNSSFPCGRALIGITLYNKATGEQIADPTNPSGLIVEDDCPTANGPTSSEAQANTFPFFRTSDSVITAPPPPGCNITAGCARVVNYTSIIDLPFAAQGYYAIYSDWSRNNSVTNLATPGGMNTQAQVLQLLIARPAASYANSSPVFSDVPVPLVCSGDTVTLINNAFDAEGDRLLYNFYAPFRGGANGRYVPGPTYETPIPVEYALGYSFAQPFGAGGYTTINPLTGETKYLIPQEGDYVVGVRVSEFRTINGVDVLLSTIEREIQLKVRQCPNNTPPSLQFGAGQTTRTIEEGEVATFTTSASVAAGNSLTLIAASPLLDGPGGFNATFNGQAGTTANAPIAITGRTLLAGNFQFTASCGSAGVYNVNVTARDNDGCPTKSTSIPFLLTVRRPAGPTAITGDVAVCPNTVATYTATGAPTTTSAYRWTVSGGVVQGSATGATVRVLWNTIGTGTLSAAAVSSLGCPSAILPLTVEVSASVTATLSGLNGTYCLNPAGAGTTITGSPAGGTFSITGAGGTTNLVGNVFTPRVAGTFQIVYAYNDPNGCAATSAAFTVVVNTLPTVVLAPALPTAVCSTDAPITLTGTVNGTATIVGFTIDGVSATVFNPAALAPGPHVVALIGTGGGNCTATATRTVTVNTTPVVLLTGLQPSYCQNAPAVALTATANGVVLAGANAVFTIDGAAATQLNPTTLAVGFHQVTVRGTGPNGCRDTDSARVEIKALPVLAITGLNPAYCRDAAPVPLTGTVNAITGGTFTIDGIAATVFNPAVLSVGTHTVVFSGTGTNACSTTLAQIVTVNPLPVYTLAAFPASVCVNAAPVVFRFTSTQTGVGAYIILGVGIFGDATSGPTYSFTLNPATLGVGTFQVVYGLYPATTPTRCSDQDTLTFTVRPLPALAITGLQPAYCADAAAVPLTGTIDGVAGGGTFTIDGRPATVLTPAALTPGAHQVVFTGTGTNACATIVTTTVQINALPTVAIIGLNAAYCAGAPAVPLLGSVNGGDPAVGSVSFTVDGQPATVFNPATLAVGPHVVVATGLLLATGCRGTISQTVTINALPIVAITNLSPAYCVSAPAVRLTSTLTGGVGTVTYTINGTTATTFNPATLGVGTFTVVATGTVTATTCQGTATQTVVINALPTVAITGLNPAYCQGEAAVPLTATLNGLPAGATVTFTINGIAATSFNPSTLAPGTYTVVATGTAPTTCVGTITQTVVINALPTVAITGLRAAYCLDAPTVPLTGTVNGVAGTVTFTIDGTVATTFSPAILGVGTHTVVAIGTDGNTCRNTTTRTVIVNALPTVAITGLSAAYCVGAAAVPLAGTVTGATGVGAFTVDGTPATSFNPATLAVGPHVVVATGTDGNTCRNTVTQTVTINALPTVAIIGLNPAYCQGDAAVTLGGTVTPSGAITFTVNGTATSVFDPSTLAPGTYTIVATGTDPNTCVGTATQTVVVNPRPTVTINGLNAVYCQGQEDLTTSISVIGGTAPATIVVSVDGVIGATLNPADYGPGVHTVVVTGTANPSGCQATATQTFTINPLPTVAFTNLSSTYCQGDPAVPLTGTVNGATGTVTFTIDGTVATTFDPGTLVPGAHTVVITGSDGNTCQNTATQIATINDRPAGLTPTGPPSVCPGLTGVPYSVRDTTNQQFTWTVVGGTVATGQGTANITVDWDAANPNASISVVTVAALTGCRSLPIALPVTVNQTLQTQTPTGSTSVCVSPDQQTFVIPNPSPGSTYTWALTGTAAGTIFGQGASTIRIRFTQAGTATLVVTETSRTPLANCFGTSAPLSVTVLAAPDGTLAIQASTPAICAGETATFTFPNTAGSTYQWFIGNTPFPNAIGNTFVFQSSTNVSGDYLIGVQETNAAGCTGPLITFDFLVHPRPFGTLQINGTALICPQNLTGQRYYVFTGVVAGTTYRWGVTGGTITSGQDTDTITVDFNGQVLPALSVIEISPFKCEGSPSTRELILDVSTPSLQLATVAEAQPTQINLNLEGLNAQAGTQVVVQRRPSGSGGAFAQVGTVAPPALTFTDPSADPNATAYDYRVDLTNACGTVLQSVEHTTVRVLATGTESSGDVTLAWNAYQGQPVKNYEVLRKNNAGSYDVVSTVPAGTLTYTATGIGRQAFEQRFRIRAVLTLNSGGGTLPYSYSNETQVTFQNAVQIYNVITPNGDDKNDRFVIENAALYPKNELVVFNRWGREVYRRTNYDNSWDGGDLPAGTYYYLFTANGQSFKSWVQIVK
ncbi:MAG: gliding motility-associated C-terminal domain-containing protein [Hymenobacteraceae bacterium]|nr:gliding motility-associated C-terminal domain-containing protein [Hymenobacteraceae bacterium]